MAKFYYNGVLLPELPSDVDMAEYPYCFIRNNTTSGYYDLVFTKLIPYYSTSNNGICMGSQEGEYSWYRILISEANNVNEWTFNATGTNYFGIDTSRTVLWSNHDIYKSANEIYFEATELVPEIEEEISWYQIKRSTLEAFGDEARRFNGGTTLPLTTTQMIEIFKNANVGLVKGYDVTFYDENNKKLAFCSVKNGVSVEAPIYGYDSWKDENGNSVIFPYMPKGNASIYALSQSYASRLYNLYNVDQGTYPYVLIFLNKDNRNLTMLIFAKGIATDGTTSISTTYNPLYGQAYNVEISDINAENLVNAVITSITSVSEYALFFEISSDTNMYVAVNYETKVNNAIRLD